MSWRMKGFNIFFAFLFLKYYTMLWNISKSNEYCSTTNGVIEYTEETSVMNHNSSLEECDSGISLLIAIVFCTRCKGK